MPSITEVLNRSEQNILTVVNAAPSTEDALAKLLRLLGAESTGNARETVLDAITRRISSILKGTVQDNGSWYP